MAATSRWLAAEADEGQRLDCFLARRLDSARNQLQRWIAAGRVTVDGRTAKASFRLCAGALVVCSAPETPPGTRVLPEAGPLTILYQDDQLVVLDKPAGLAVHPGAGRPAGTLANRLLARYPELASVGGPGRPGIVHRLDKDTTGVLAVARTGAAYLALSGAFSQHTVEKIYLAVIYGRPGTDRGVIDLAIARHAGDRTRMAARPGGRPARTRYRLLAEASGCALLRLMIETGRTHQIRVHMKATGHPLVGDPVYGEARWRSITGPARRALRQFPRPALHAWKLSLDHPHSAQRCSFEAPVPADLRTLWQAIGGHWPT